MSKRVQSDYPLHLVRSKHLINVSFIKKNYYLWIEALTLILLF